MARDKGHLTDLQLRHWIKAGKPLAKADGDGLTFALSAAGVAGWILRYRHGGRRRELTIGRYPDIGLAEARGIATLKRAEVQRGRNPAAEEQKAKATAAREWTVRDLAKDYRAKKLVSLAHSTQVSYGRHLKRVEKKLGALTVREIEASDVVALIDGAGLTWGESNMLLITTKCLFTHACGKRLINANPCHGIMPSALLGERPPRRQRLMLTREELKLLLAAPMRRRNALAIRILLATAVRSAELYQAKWADVDLDGAQWHIPKSKTGAAMDIPLAPVVVDWFQELRTWCDQQIVKHARSDENARLAMQVRGVGPLSASALAASLGDLTQFRNGRQFGAWLGLVPRQCSSGGTQRLGRITKRGDACLRKLLVLGARSALTVAARHDDADARWALQLQGRVDWPKACVALANQNARTLWRTLARRNPAGTPAEDASS